MANLSFDTPIQSSDQSFDRVLKAGIPVAAVFFSNSLGSDLEAQMKASARAEAGKLLVVKIKLDENPELQRRYNLNGTTFIGFKNGDECIRFPYPSADVFGELVGFLLDRNPAPRAAAQQQQQQTTSRPTTDGQAKTDGHPVAVTDASFAHDVVQASVPVVVDLWAPWCGPCRMVAPTLEKLAGEYAGRLRIAKLNVDENPRTAQSYQVSGIPTLLFFKNGRLVDRVVGALPERQLRGAVERFLNT